MVTLTKKLNPRSKSSRWKRHFGSKPYRSFVKRNSNMLPEKALKREINRRKTFLDLDGDGLEQLAHYIESHQSDFSAIERKIIRAFCEGEHQNSLADRLNLSPQDVSLIRMEAFAKIVLTHLPNQKNKLTSEEQEILSEYLKASGSSLEKILTTSKNLNLSKSVIFSIIRTLLSNFIGSVGSAIRKANSS